jgi:hypothetical protein
VTDLDPVMVGEPMWVRQKYYVSAEARVRAIPEYRRSAAAFMARREDFDEFWCVLARTRGWRGA